MIDAVSCVSETHFKNAIIPAGFIAVDINIDFASAPVSARTPICDNGGIVGDPGENPEPTAELSGSALSNPVFQFNPRPWCCYTGLHG